MTTPLSNEAGERCIVLHNVFDASVQREDDFYLTIRDHFLGGSARCGAVHHVFVDRKSGCVYMLLDSTRSANNAAAKWNNSVYDGNLINISFSDTAQYESTHRVYATFAGGAFWNSTLRPDQEGPTSGRTEDMTTPLSNETQDMTTPLSNEAGERCIVLHNVFDASVQREDDFYLDIRDHFLGRSARCGAVHHVFVDRKSGCVYMLLDTARSANKAAAKWNNSVYDGNLINISFSDTAEYESTHRVYADMQAEDINAATVEGRPLCGLT